MILSSPSFLWCSAGSVLGWWLYSLVFDRRNNPRGLPLPPGPKGYPIIDNLLNFPTTRPWLVYDKWSKIYGDMIYFKVLGQPFLILGSVQRTYDLFEKRSSNYSDRSRMPMLNEVMDWTWNMAFLPYGTWWRRHRRAFHDHFHPNVVQKYYPVQTNTTRALLRQLLKSPDDFMHHIRQAFASTILKIGYGMAISDEHNSYTTTAEIAMSSLSAVGNPGSFLVDLFPFMKYIPGWLPGAEWKRKGDYWRQVGHTFANKPWGYVKEKLKEGTAETCIATTLIEKLPEVNSPDRVAEELLARNTCATSFVGGADTTVSTLQTFIMAMALYPEVQKKAQEELDLVLDGRLPEFNDRPNLPYINALVKETMRWQLVAPLAAPHQASEADEYDGYYIPKGTIVIGNAWTILHDPEAYKDPLNYIPERFLKNGKIDLTVRDPSVAFWGFGRRICPGRFMSDNSMYILMANILAVYNIQPDLDQNGNEIPIKPQMTNGLISYPEQFKCRITPRSRQAEELIQNSGIMD